MIEEDIFADIGHEVRKELTKALQRKIAECLEKDGITNLTLSALGNTLVSLCMQNKVKKEAFLEKMSLAWDHHENQ